MVVHVCDRAAQSGATTVHVATDDERIASAVRRHGHQALMTGAGHASGTDRLCEAARLLRLEEDEIVVNVQGDEPLIAARLISQVADFLEQRHEAMVSTACHPIHDSASLSNPNVVKVVLDAKGYALYFSRSPIPYPREPGATPCYRHAGIYAYRAAFLEQYAVLPPSPPEKAEGLEQLRVLWHGYRIAVAISADEVAPGVDTPQDLEAVRRMLR